MTAQDLKNSILQLAMQGKLVLQDPNDEPASELLKKIKAEKIRLIKEGKIRREKPLLPISEDEIPFDIPENWQWVRIIDVAFLKSGNQYTESCEGKLYLKVADLNLSDNQIEIMTSTRRADVRESEMVPVNSIIFPKRGGAIATNKKRLVLRESICIDSNIMAMTVCCSKMISFMLMWFSSIDLGKLATGTSVPQINNKDIYPLLIPLPPLEEQNRILAKYEELLPLIERYDESEKRLLELNKKFPGELRKAILHQAVQGKLTEQDPHDEPASELIKRIKTEKARLIKEGKIKKEKPLPLIYDEEIPFDIPEGWEWVRFNDIVHFINGDRSNKYPKDSDLVASGIPFWGAVDMINGGLKYTEGLRFISTEKFKELRSGKLIDGDFVCLLRGAVGKWAEFSATETYSTGFINAQMIIMRLIDLQLSPYFRVFLQSVSFELQKQQRVTGSAIAQMSAANLQQFIIPIPPLAEQKRIAAKVEELFPLCDSLK